MNKFQAMAQIMAILCEDGSLPKGSDKYKIARKLVSSRIERLGPDAAYNNVKMNKNALLEQIEEVQRFWGLDRF
jgi:hypothetical protein